MSYSKKLYINNKKIGEQINKNKKYINKEIINIIIK
jgi:hypothetical protein